MTAVAAIGLSPGWWLAILAGVLLATAACADVFRSGDLATGPRALWTVFVLCVPIVGPAVYFGVRRT